MQFLLKYEENDSKCMYVKSEVYKQQKNTYKKVTR